jgi:uncharacterized protein
MKTTYYPSVFNDLKLRLGAKLNWIQVVLGPRQVGKSTGVKWVLETLKKEYKLPYHYCTADEPLSVTDDWIITQWMEAKKIDPSAILVIDEIQKASSWTNIIKKLWDEQKNKKEKLKVVLLGSSSLKIQEGLKESLAGRFELLKIHHWNFWESNQIYKMTLEEFLNCGGYPGTYELMGDFDRFKRLIQDSIISPIINEDLLAHSVVKKPILFKRCFEILASYPAQEIAYTKLLGDMQEKGNVEIIKHYISLYEAAFLFKTIHKYTTRLIQKRSSAPKIIPLCPVLSRFSKNKADLGRIFEAAVGAELLRLDGELYYWRENDDEVDYIFEYNDELFAIEVKYGKEKSTKGLAAFLKKFPSARPLLITPIEYQKLLENPKEFFDVSKI